MSKPIRKNKKRLIMLAAVTVYGFVTASLAYDDLVNFRTTLKVLFFVSAFPLAMLIGINLPPRKG